MTIRRVCPHDECPYPDCDLEVEIDDGMEDDDDESTGRPSWAEDRRLVRGAVA